MSLILEALRKSEAERRRGDAPDLRVELPPPAAPKRRARPFALTATVALLAVVLLVALWPREDGSGDRVTGDLRGPSDAPLAVEPARPAAAAAAAATTDDAAGPFPSVDRIEPRDDPAPTPPSTPRAVGEDDLPLAPPPMAQRAADEAARDADAAAGSTAAAPPPASTPVSTPASVPAVPAPARARDMPRIAELSPGMRQRLPPMKLSLHMWNEDPARRFAVVDGQRRIEGDRVGEATLAAIDREGLVLELDGQRIRVPLP